MSAADLLSMLPGGPLILGFQVWDAVGWLGQALFTMRVLVQWTASERQGRSVVPQAFWWLSLLGSLALVVYTVHRRDPVFLAGVSINTAIYVRNLYLVYRPQALPPAKRNPWTAVGIGLGLCVAVAFVLYRAGTQIVSFDQPLPWLVLGFTAQSIWSSRFILQWYASEKAGRSVLPASFFYVSTVGAVLLLIYAVYRVDWVFMAAYALNPIPYARNLILLRREARAARGEA